MPRAQAKIQKAAEDVGRQANKEPDVLEQRGPSLSRTMESREGSTTFSAVIQSQFWCGAAVSGVPVGSAPANQKRLTGC